MTNQELRRRAAALAQPVCQAAGVSLWDVTFEKEGRQLVLTIYIDRPEGVCIEDCETVSRAMDPLLDAPEYAALPPYTLSVSSAGLERALTRPEHFAWAMGKPVQLTFYQAHDGMSELAGVLTAHDGSTVTITCGEMQKSFPAAEVAHIRLSFEA